MPLSIKLTLPNNTLAPIPPVEGGGHVDDDGNVLNGPIHEQPVLVDPDENLPRPHLKRARVVVEDSDESVDEIQEIDDNGTSKSTQDINEFLIEK